MTRPSSSGLEPTEGRRASVDCVVQYARCAEPEGRFSESVGLAEVVRLDPTAARAFPQTPGSLNALLGSANSELPQAEDAFQLRIQAPEGAHDLPVIVFIPGGGFLSGTGLARWFTSPALTAGGPAILVTVNYRIGVLGHLGPQGGVEESQRPVRDLLQALRWVNDHIGSFGGDSGNITLAGDSAGAWHSFALASMEQAAGLFRRLALISMPWEPPLSEGQLRHRHDLVSAELEGLGGITEASVDAVLQTQGTLAREYAGRGMPLLPAAGGPIANDLHDYTHSASRLNVESLLLLSTSEEAAGFLFPVPETAFPDEAFEAFVSANFENPTAVSDWIDRKRPESTGKERMAELMTLHQFRLAHLELGHAASTAGVEVHLGGFSVQSPLPSANSPHCMPLPFLFGNRQSWWDAPMVEGLPPETFASTAVALQEWFIGFLTDGRPRLEGTPLAEFDPRSPQRLEFSEEAATFTVPTELHLTARR